MDAVKERTFEEILADAERKFAATSANPATAESPTTCASGSLAPVPVTALLDWLRSAYPARKPQKRAEDENGVIPLWDELWEANRDVQKCATCPKHRHYERWCDSHPRASNWHLNAGPCLRPDRIAPTPAATPYALALSGCLERVCAGTGNAADAQRIGRWLPQGAHAAHLLRLNDKPHGEALLREMMVLEELLRQAGVAMDFSEPRRFEITHEPPTDLPAIPRRPTGTCYTCGGSSFWASRWVERICYRCHPPRGTPERGEACEKRAEVHGR